MSIESAPGVFHDWTCLSDRENCCRVLCREVRQAGSKGVLVVAPHMDDEVLGCGGLIAREIEAGSYVGVAFLTAGRKYHGEFYCEKSLRQIEHCKAAMEALGVHWVAFGASIDEEVNLKDAKQFLEVVSPQFMPNVVMVPNRDDVNQDHQTCFRAANIAFREHGLLNRHGVGLIAEYEVPSSTDESWLGKFQPNLYLPLEARHVCQKLDAFGMYEDETRYEDVHPRCEEMLVTLTKHRGMYCGHEYAEAYRVVKQVYEFGIGTKPLEDPL